MTDLTYTSKGMFTQFYKVNFMEKFKREIFVKHNPVYLMCECEKIGDWFICFHESKGYFLATFMMGTVGEVTADDYEIRKLLEELAEKKENL